MQLAIFAVLAFGFGLGMWEFLEVESCKKLCGEYAYQSNLPRSFSWPVFKLWKFSGEAGFFAVAWVGWKHGFLGSIGFSAAYVALGALIGFGIQWSIEALVRREESSYK